ncbi:MAG TPA: hypothetical protein VNS58_02450 [Puia sp.]|nr:hypothetical protein [Puia sp.]
MPTSLLLLLRSLVKPFYRHNAGFFLFLFLVFFGAVAPSTQLAYHYALILGMLNTPAFLGIVFFAWLLYAWKCDNWVTSSLQNPDFNFLNLLSRMDKRQSFWWLLAVQIMLLLPVSLYALAVTGVALHKGCYGIALAVQAYIIFGSLAGARRYQYVIDHPGHRGDPVNADHPGIPGVRTRMLLSFLRPRRLTVTALPYWTFFIRYLFHANKALLLGLKFFGCALLYLLLKDPDPTWYDIRMPFLIYSLALFGHGVLIYRCRELEEKRLLFYRSLPVSLSARFLQFACLYFLLLLPEMLTIGWLTPTALRWKDALGFMLSGYSVLLLLHSVLTATSLKMEDFLKLSLGVFGILYLCVLGDVLIALSGCFFVAAGGLFRGGYWAKDLFHFKDRQV